MVYDHKDVDSSSLETRPTEIEGFKGIKETRALQRLELERISRKGAKAQRGREKRASRNLGTPARPV